MKMLNKKGEVVDQLKVFIMGFVVIGLVLAVGLMLLQNFSTAVKTTSVNGVYTTASSTLASNATDDMITKLATAPTWLGLLLVVVFSTIILAYFYAKE